MGMVHKKRDFVYVDDVVRATILAMEKGKPGEAYNVGTGVPVSFNEVFKVISDELNYKGEPKYVPMPYKSYQMFTQADTKKAEKELGFKASYNLKEGVRDIIITL